MQELIRRNFWMVHLAAVAVGAYLAAGVATEVVATLVLKVPARSAKDAAPPAPASHRPVKPESKVSLMSTLGSHNIFDAEPKVVDESDSGGPEAEPKSIDIDIDLLGTLVSSNPEWSMATVRLQGNPKLVRVGVKLQERIEVVEIASRYILLQDGPLQKVVKLWGDYAPKPAAPKPATPVVGAPATGSDAFAKGVKKTGPYDYQLDRSMLEENLQDLTKLGMQARIVPNYEDGKYHGFRLVGIAPNSLYRAIGLESGDLVKRVNGRDIDTPNKAIELFEQLRQAPTISLDVERRGQKVTMTYAIK